MHPKMLTPTYIHDLDIYAMNNYHCDIASLDKIFKDINKMFNDDFDENFDEDADDKRKDVLKVNATIIQTKIMKDIVSIRFSDATIVLISRVDYDDNALFINDYSKETIIREFALEVY